jgi:hypothetical protein
MKDGSNLQLQLDDINWFIKFKSTATFNGRSEMVKKKCPCCVARIFSIDITWTDAEITTAKFAVGKLLQRFQDNINLDDLKGII